MDQLSGPGEYIIYYFGEISNTLTEFYMACWWSNFKEKYNPKRYQISTGQLPDNLKCYGGSLGLTECYAKNVLLSIQWSMLYSHYSAWPLTDIFLNIVLRGVKIPPDKIQPRQKNQFSPERILLKSQKNCQSHLKSNVLFTPISNISLKLLSRWLEWN